MNARRLNLRLIALFVVLSALSTLLVLNKASALLWIKLVLESEHLNATLWLGFICCFVVRYLSIETKDINNDDSGLIFTHFGKFADTAFAIVTYGLASTTSAAILKGVYIQQFFGEKIYFSYFDQIDIYSMLIVCLFLFGYSLYAAINSLVQAFVLPQEEIPTPVK